MAETIEHQGRNSNRKFTILAIAAILLAGLCLVGSIWLNRDNDDSSQTASQETIAYDGQDGVDALSLLKQSADVTTKTYDFGELVESIDGIGGADDSTHSWILYINGQAAQTGASDVITADSDRLEWRYEAL